MSVQNNSEGLLVFPFWCFPGASQELLMADQRISKKLVDETRPTKAEFTIWDKDLTGFGLRVRPRAVQRSILSPLCNMS